MRIICFFVHLSRIAKLQTGILYCFHRFEHCGIYIVMVSEIWKNMLKLFLLVGLLTLAYGLLFYALMLREVRDENISRFCS